MIEMVVKPEFVRDQLSLAMATGRLILRNRKAKQRFKVEYSQMTPESLDHQP